MVVETRKNRDIYFALVGAGRALYLPSGIDGIRGKRGKRIKVICPTFKKASVLGDPHHITFFADSFGRYFPELIERFDKRIQNPGDNSPEWYVDFWRAFERRPLAVKYKCLSVKEMQELERIARIFRQIPDSGFSSWRNLRNLKRNNLDVAIVNEAKVYGALEALRHYNDFFDTRYEMARWVGTSEEADKFVKDGLKWRKGNSKLADALFSGERD